jgi:hypothetical protein
LKALGKNEDHLGSKLEQLCKNKKIIKLISLEKPSYIHVNYLKEKINELESILKNFHSENPLKIGMSKEEIKNRVFGKNIKQKHYDELLEALVQRNIIKITNKFIALSSFTIKFTKDFIRTKNLLTEDIFIEGYYECSKYFEHIDNMIKKEFTPKYALMKKNERLYNIIQNTNSICVSIRRGDFFTEEYSKVYGVCDIGYFYRGIDYIRKIYPGSTVIVFSDDIEWVKAEMKFSCRVFYEDGTDPVWEKLRLMYSCKHFVISNSTFSWWAQHLSRSSNKIVVAPKVWKTTDNIYDIKEDNWILLE